MNDKLQTYCISVNNPTTEQMIAMNEALVKAQDAYIEAVQQLAERYCISNDAAHSVLYLQSRSRWTQEKEYYLLSLARMGKELPPTYDNFEVPWGFWSKD